MSVRRTPVAAAVLALGLIVALPAPSFAVAGESNKLTLWQNDGYQGQPEARASYDSTFTNDPCSGCDPGPGGNFNDDASSFVNKTSSWWILYEDSQYGGARVCVRPNSHDSNIGNDTNYEDDISSVEKRGTSQPAGCTDTSGTAN